MNHLHLLNNYGALENVAKSAENRKIVDLKFNERN